MGNQCTAHDRHIIGAGQVAVLVQAVAVEKCGVLHTQLLGPLVHLLDKFVLASRYIFSQHHSRIIGAHNYGGFQQIVHRHDFPLFQPDVRATHGGSVSACRYFIIQLDLPGIQRFHYQQQRHHLSDRSAGTLLMGVFLEKNFSGRFFHQHSRRRGKIPERRSLYGGHGNLQQQNSEHSGNPFFQLADFQHRHLLLWK